LDGISWIALVSRQRDAVELQECPDQRGRDGLERGSMPILGTADKARHLTRPRKSEYPEIETGVSRPGTGHNHGCLFFHCIFNGAGANGV
jgi:hypothetical protein